MLLARLITLCAFSLGMAFAFPVAADEDEVTDGYGAKASGGEPNASHDGYVREGQATTTPDPTNYVVIEAEQGTTEEVDGETVIVVEEPKPIAASVQAPPPAQVIVVEEQIPPCPGGVWVDGYWYYSNGQYLWVDGHCVVVRVNYVFVHPRWDFYGGLWWFVPGYYRPYGVYVGFGYYRPWYWYPPFYHPYYPARRPVPAYRAVPRRPTSAYPTPRTPSRAVSTRPTPRPTTRAPRQPTTVIYRAPTGTTRTGTIRRTGTGPTITGTTPQSRPGRGMVSQPRLSPTRTLRGRPSSTRSWKGTSGRTRSAPSWGTSRSRGSSRPSTGGFSRDRSGRPGRSR